MGAPVGHGFVIHQLRHAEHRDGGAVQRGADLGQQLLRLKGLLHRLRIRLDLRLLNIFHRLLTHNRSVLVLLRHLGLLHQSKIAGHADGRQT